jgi:protein TonB
MPALGKAHAAVAEWKKVALSTENDRFKARYNTYFRRALYATLAVCVLVFWFSPQIVVTPYKLAEEEIQVVDIPQNFDIPPPPQELPRPQVPIEAAPDAEVDEEVEIADTLPTDFDYVPPPPTGMTGNNFVAFDTKPEIVTFAGPVYPEFAREAALQGLVLVNVLVGTDGRVQQAIIVQSAHKVLDEAALAAARKCIFTPGRQRDMAVPVWVTLPYNFSLY